VVSESLACCGLHWGKRFRFGLPDSVAHPPRLLRAAIPIVHSRSSRRGPSTLDCSLAEAGEAGLGDNSGLVSLGLLHQGIALDERDVNQGLRGRGPVKHARPLGRTVAAEQTLTIGPSRGKGPLGYIRFIYGQNVASSLHTDIKRS